MREALKWYEVYMVGKVRMDTNFSREINKSVEVGSMQQYKCELMICLLPFWPRSQCLSAVRWR